MLNTIMELPIWGRVCIEVVTGPRPRTGWCQVILMLLVAAFFGLPSRSSPLTSTATLPSSIEFANSSSFSSGSGQGIWNPFASSPASPKENNSTSKIKPTFKYPLIERNETLVEQMHDRPVADPYRSLEDPNAEKTKQFVKSQNEITEPYLNKCPHRAKIREILAQNQEYEQIGCPIKSGNNYYFFKNSGFQQQPVLYQQSSLDSEPTVFFDPNLLSSDGTVSMSFSSFSPNGEYFAYCLNYNGSDWMEIHVMHVPTGKNLDDKLVRVKFSSIEWTHDNRGFFYAHFAKHTSTGEGTETDSHENHSIFYHLLNTPQSEDVLKVGFPDHIEWLVSIEITHDGRYLNVYVHDGCKDHDWFYSDLTKSGLKDKLPLVPIYEKMDAEFEYVTNNGKIVYFRTNLDAMNYRIVKLDLDKPSKENWVDVVPNHPTDVLEWAEAHSVDGRDYLLVNSLRKVVHNLELRDLEGSVLKRFNIPLGTISKNSGRRKHSEFFFQLSSFLTPEQTYRYDLKELNSEPQLFHQSRPENFDAGNYATDQVFYASKDGTKVPMFLVHRRGLERNGENPCLLYGYGGFDQKVTPTFDMDHFLWLKNFNGILAVANIRGGGELGQNWHNSGRLLNKQNSFDDFIAAAEYLIANNYTKRERLAIEGESNGGLLVATSSNQRPDLFGASICHVGVLDMIRFPEFTIGYAWVSDYGNPKEKEHFQNLIGYSPYHNIPDEADRYPATLLLTADHDDRVVPAHSLKFIAQLQHKLGQKLPETPLLIRVDTKAGHGSGKPLAKVTEQYTDTYSFLCNALGLEDSFTDA